LERYREEEYRSQDMAAAAARAKKQRDELAAKKKASDARIAEATRQYQQMATPLSERVREIQVERPAPAVAVSAKYPDTPVFKKAGVAGKKVRQVSAPGAREAPSIPETYVQAREELVTAGYREEDLETPFVDLGGTEETGFVPPYVLAQMEEDAGIPEAERSPVTEPYRAIVQVDRAYPHRRAHPWAGIVYFGALISFALIVAKEDKKNDQDG